MATLNLILGTVVIFYGSVNHWELHNITHIQSCSSEYVIVQVHCYYILVQDHLLVSGKWVQRSYQLPCGCF